MRLASFAGSRPDVGSSRKSRTGASGVRCRRSFAPAIRPTAARSARPAVPTARARLSPRGRVPCARRVQHRPGIAVPPRSRGLLDGQLRVEDVRPRDVAQPLPELAVDRIEVRACVWTPGGTAGRYPCQIRCSGPLPAAAWSNARRESCGRHDRRVGSATTDPMVRTYGRPVEHEIRRDTTVGRGEGCDLAPTCRENSTTVQARPTSLEAREETIGSLLGDQVLLGDGEGSRTGRG